MSKRQTKAKAKQAKKPARKPAAPRTKRAAEPIEMPAPKRRAVTYDPAFCGRVIELGEEGKSKAQIARALGCSRKSLYLWMNVHPEFAEAMDEAQFACLAWWEDAGQRGLTMPKFNASVYSYAMENRFREFYGDKVELEHTDNTDAEGRQLTNLDLARRIAFVFHEAMEEKREQEGAPEIDVSLPPLVRHVRP